VQKLLEVDVDEATWEYAEYDVEEVVVDDEVGVMVYTTVETETERMLSMLLVEVAVVMEVEVEVAFAPGILRCGPETLEVVVEVWTDTKARVEVFWWAFLKGRRF
jgi:hypothetical protein